MTSFFVQNYCYDLMDSLLLCDAIFLCKILLVFWTAFQFSNVTNVDVHWFMFKFKKKIVHIRN